MGRVTYFYAQIGDKKLPVYQPGTIMFETGVLNFGELAIHPDGEENQQSNGAVLGDQCALFLAKFIATLILTYNENLEMFGNDIEGPID